MRIVERKIGYNIVKDDCLEDAMPIACPVCDIVMSSNDDRVSYIKWNCCSLCDTLWVQGRIERWLDGWRPEKIAVQDVLRSRGLL